MDEDQLLIQDISSSSDESNNLLAQMPPILIKGQQKHQHQHQNQNVATVRSLTSFHSTNQQRLEYVPFEIFRETIKGLERRILILEDQLRKGAKDLNNSQSEYSDIKPRSPTYLSGLQDDMSMTTEQRANKTSPHTQKRSNNQTRVGQPSPTRQNLTPGRQTESQINRLNLFEKRLKATEEKTSKFFKDQDLFRREIEKKFDASVKRITDDQDKTTKLRSDLTIRIEDLGSNQRSIVQHLHSIGQEIQECQQSFATTKEEMDKSLLSLNSRMEIFQRNYSRDEEIMKELQQSQLSLENDILIILKNYKENLNEVLKIQLLSEDVKHIYSVINDM